MIEMDFTTRLAALALYVALLFTPALCFCAAGMWALKRFPRLGRAADRAFKKIGM